MSASDPVLDDLDVAAPGRVVKEFTWGQIAAQAPVMAATMARYLDQLAVSARPGTVDAYELALRFFAGHLTSIDPRCVTVVGIGRHHIEAHKRWIAARPGRGTPTWSPTTIRHRLGLLRSFFERIIEWGYDDAPSRVPIYEGDLPKPDEALPKFLDDPTAARFMAALAVDPNQRRRLMVELLARTGMRAGELASLEAGAMIDSGGTHWLRIPSASSTTTAASPCSPNSSSSSPTGTPPGHQPVPGGSSNETTDSPSTAAPSTATSPQSPSAPGSATCIPTSSATPLPPPAPSSSPS